MHRIPLALLGFAGVAVAQSPYQGFLFNWDRPTVGAHFDLVTRWNVTTESNLNRVDLDDYREWGATGTGTVSIRALALWIQDTNYATAESFSFIGHAEDPANPNSPLLTAAFTVPNIPMPPGVAGNAYLVNGTLNQAVTIPNTGDVFVGIGLPAMPGPTPPYDGLWLGTITRTQPGLAVFDEPGPRGQVGGGIARENYNCVISGGVPNYGPPGPASLSQVAVDVGVGNGGVGGVALAQTNQTSLPPSNAPRGTSDFLSGLHPDVIGLNPGRADDIGFAVTHHTGQMAVGSPVLMLLALGPSPIGAVSLNTLPGFDALSSAGTLCIDFTNAVSFLAISQPGFLANQAEAQVVVPLTPQARAFVSTVATPFDFWWQGFAIDAAAPGPDLEVRASGCVVQHLK